jgi:hypothetical protein
MTTAHRPTFDPARGGTGRNESDLSKLSRQYSSRDMPSETKLKYRQTGQGHPDEISSKVLLVSIQFPYLFINLRSFRISERKSRSVNFPLKTRTVDQKIPLLFHHLQRKSGLLTILLVSDF